MGNHELEKVHVGSSPPPDSANPLALRVQLPRVELPPFLPRTVSLVRLHFDAANELSRTHADAVYPLSLRGLVQKAVASVAPEAGTFVELSGGDIDEEAL